jgi:hypothetical protein
MEVDGGFRGVVVDALQPHRDGHAVVGLERRSFVGEPSAKFPIAVPVCGFLAAVERVAVDGVTVGVEECGVETSGFDVADFGVVVLFAERRPRSGCFGDDSEIVDARTRFVGDVFARGLPEVATGGDGEAGVG